MEEQLKELRKKRDSINQEIQKIENERMGKRLKETEDNYLGHCYESDHVIFKVVCAAASNEYRVCIIGFEKNPRLVNEQDIFDNSFHRHPYMGRTTLDFVIEDDIMIRDLKEYKEITKEEFEIQLRESMDKLSKEMEQVFKIK